MLQAASKDQIHIMVWLSALGAPFEYETATARASALHSAVLGPASAECIKWLLDKGVSVTGRDEQGGTPLHCAVGPGYNADVVRLLIAAGSDLNVMCRGGATVLHRAAVIDNAAAIDVLLAAGADPFAAARPVLLPLYGAIRSNSPAALRSLLASSRFRAPENAAAATQAVRNAMNSAAMTGKAECLAGLFATGLWRQHVQYSPEVIVGSLFHVASTVAVIDEVLNHIPAGTAQCMCLSTVEDGQRVLHSAVKAQRPVHVICKLLKLGADPLVLNLAGQTAAELARAQGQTLIAQLLDRAAQDRSGAA